MAGYSETPLAKKLGLKGDSLIWLSAAPENYLRLVSPLPEGARIVTDLSDQIDIIHIFSKSKSELAETIRACLKKMKPDARLWVSWPKKTSRVATDITEDAIREIARPLGLVDIKVCAVDEVWSALMLVIRKRNRER